MGVLDQRGNLSGRKAIVVGGGAGIGRAVTLALAQAGMQIAFCDIDSAGVDQTRADVQAAGCKVLGVVADATVSAQLAAFYAQAGQFLGSADLVLNIVGGVLLRPFMEKSAEECAQDIQRNYGYVIESTRHAVPLLRQTGRGGCIINFTTIEAHRAAGGFSVYAGAKAATTQFSKAMAWELGPEGIRVNIIAPDTTDSPGNRAALAQADYIRQQQADLKPEWFGDAMRMYIPLQQPPSQDDLANAVLFLASDLAKSITGQVLHVDGGTAAALGMIRWPGEGGHTLPVPVGTVLKKLFA